MKATLEHCGNNYSDWTGFVMMEASKDGYHPLQATRARMFYLNVEPRFYTQVKDVHGKLTAQGYPHY